jgi:succinyl-diaminopimelate desuccinylase
MTGAMSPHTGRSRLDAVELTRQLIRFDTINPPGRERACAEFLADLLSAAGFAVTLPSLDSERTNLVATRGGDKRQAPLVFTGHIDVVPLGARAWQHDPFGAEIMDGRIHGRGSSDMKSGVASFVVAAIEEADRLGDATGVTLIITAGEETGCEGAISLVGGQPLAPAGALVVAEPTGAVPYVGHKGALWLKGTTAGVTAHGSMPEHGDNAVYKAARAVDRLSRFAFDVDAHPTLGKPTLNVGSLHGGLNINSVPDRAEFAIDIRTTPSVDHAALRVRIQDHMQERVDVEVLVDLPGIWTPPDAPWAARVAQIASRITGIAPQTRAATYFTDASVLTPALGGVPTVILGPGEPTQAHQTDEWCDVAHIGHTTAIYRALIADWVSAAAQPAAARAG